MSNFFTKKEWDEINEVGLKSMKKSERYKNRFQYYNLIISLSAVLIAIASLVVSIIALL